MSCKACSVVRVPSLVAVELVALRRVGACVGAGATSEGRWGVHRFRRLTLRSATDWSQRDQCHHTFSLLPGPALIP